MSFMHIVQKLSHVAAMLSYNKTCVQQMNLKFSHHTTYLRKVNGKEVTCGEPLPLLLSCIVQKR